MGSGKSTIGPILAEALKFKFIDLDSYIEKKEGKSISQIFNDSGEKVFRSLESGYLLKLANQKGLVIALGGGTPCFVVNQKIIDFERSVFLQSSLDNLTKRLFKGKIHRPLIANFRSIKGLKSFIRKLRKERRPYYLKAKYRVRNDNDRQKTVSRIIKKINSKINS